ncbi:hypothetical protein OBBRIDRAFT_41680 [Obba rivulosa]|uniref:Uncharacterized protein n=1 Tax=Obba rivulosa TaxID=1052685 RepID=A0A8E2AR17_9APHY|nr:hypothetical protein OBBRIDRAFT_41680 [Obba rivulosa]
MRALIPRASANLHITSTYVTRKSAVRTAGDITPSCANIPHHDWAAFSVLYMVRRPSKVLFLKHTAQQRQQVQILSAHGCNLGTPRQPRTQRAHAGDLRATSAQCIASSRCLRAGPVRTTTARDRSSVTFAIRRTGCQTRAVFGVSGRCWAHTYAKTCRTGRIESDEDVRSGGGD